VSNSIAAPPGIRAIPGVSVIVVESPAAPDHVAKTLRATGAEIVVSYLPMMKAAAHRSLHL
jgi:hypothetical protein